MIGRNEQEDDERSVGEVKFWIVGLCVTKWREKKNYIRQKKYYFCMVPG